MCFDRRHVCERTLARSPRCVSTGTVARGVFKKVEGGGGGVLSGAISSISFTRPLQKKV